MKNFHLVNKHLITEWKYKDTFQKESATTNVFIGCTTTTYGRIALYNGMQAAGLENVFYTDTDSMVVLCDREQYPVPVSPYLGQYKDELDDGSGEKDFIKTFVSAGPKNYAYLTNKGHSEVKIKGFTLNSKTSKVLNYSSMKYLVTQNPQGSIATSEWGMVREKFNFLVVQCQKHKLYRIVNDKRNFDYDSFTSTPYGYAA